MLFLVLFKYLVIYSSSAGDFTNIINRPKLHPDSE